MSPQRIQLRRTKGWRKPEGAIVVARPTRWGNFWKVDRNRVPLPPHGSGHYDHKGEHWTVFHTNRHGFYDGPSFGDFGDRFEATEFAVDLFRRSLLARRADLNGDRWWERYIAPLQGHDLACWCPFWDDETGHDWPCHADVLLDLANRVPSHG